MPIFEGSCLKCSIKYEYLLRSWSESDPKCPKCKKSLSRLISAANPVWAKPLGDYCGKNEEGHWAYSREGEEVTKHFIKSRKDQREFCKRYGYINPEDLPSEAPITKYAEAPKGNGGWISGD